MVAGAVLQLLVGQMGLTSWGDTELLPAEAVLVCQRVRQPVHVRGMVELGGRGVHRLLLLGGRGVQLHHLTGHCGGWVVLHLHLPVEVAKPA